MPRQLRILFALLCVAGCSLPPPAPRASTRPVTMLVFGDSGYTYEYIEPDELTPPLSAEQFAADWREEWLEDKRPLEDYALPATTVLPATGGTVEATGLGRVSAAMQRFCAAGRCDLGTMLGDNIYPNGATLGADGHDDARRFRTLLFESFRGLVPADRDFRIYATLGNHDWNTSREGAIEQLHFLEKTSPFYMDGLVYRVKPPAAHGTVEIFAIDTTLLLGAYDVPEALLDDDGAEITSAEPADVKPWTAPQPGIERDMVAWLERSLASSDARWKIVIGHHPLWSSAGSKFQQAHVLRELLLPALCRYADLYLAGHEHTLEVHVDDCAVPGVEPRAAALLQVVSGAAAKQRPLNRAFMAHQARDHPDHHTLWARGLVWGFAHLTLQPDTVTVRMLTVPNDGDVEPVIAYEYTHARRSGT